MDRTIPCTVDTLAIFQRLKKTSLQEDAAHEITEVIKDVVETNQITRNDLERTKSDLELAIVQTKSELEASMVRTKSELEASICRTKSELEIAIERSKSDLAKWMAGLMIAQAAVIVALIKLL